MPYTPYDQLESIVQSARVRLNDAIQSIAGEILTDTSQFTPSVINNAWRRLQEYLADRGFSTLNKETVFSGVPAWTATDPVQFVYFDWQNYWDGTASQPAPIFPIDMIAPLDLYERVTGSNAIFTPLDQVYNGLPTANPAGGTTARDALNRLWEWRQQIIYMPGASGLTDIRLRYASFYADFEVGIQDQLSAAMTVSQTTLPLVNGSTIATGQPGSGSYVQVDQEIMQVTAGGGTANPTVTRAQLGTVAMAHNQGAYVIVVPWGIQVPIMRSLNSFAWFICSEMARPRGDLDAGEFDTLAMAAAEQIWNRDYRQGKSLYKRAELGKVRDTGTRANGANAPVGGGT